MRRFNATIATALCCTLLTALVPQKAHAQAVIGVPVVETVIIGGIVYYVWQNWQGEEQQSTTYPMLEDPEDEAQWGEFSARDLSHCRYMAAGRDWVWDQDTKTCSIKG